MLIPVTTNRLKEVTKDKTNFDWIDSDTILLTPEEYNAYFGEKSFKGKKNLLRNKGSVSS